MAPSDDDALATALTLLPALAEHLDRAEKLLPHRRAETDDPDDAAPDHHRALRIARRALAHVAKLTEGAQRSYPPRASIALLRSPDRSQLCIWGTPSEDDVATFISELRQFDERVLASAELTGLLLGLALRWSAAGFAPPLVLASLGEHVPQILTLGQRIIATHDADPPA